MKISVKFITFIIILHLILIVLSWFLLQEKRYLFIGAEFLIFISLYISYRIYRSFIQPLNLISAGIETIKDKDYSSTILPVGQPEMDQLIVVYNRMIEQLRSERLSQKEQHYFLEKLIMASPSGIIIFDYNNKVSMINPSASKLLNIKKNDNKNPFLKDLTGKLPETLVNLKSGETEVVNISGVQSFKCTKSQFLDQGYYNYFIMIEELTNELLITEKNAYEKLIRMMSHEINNSVGAINSILNSSLPFKNQLLETDQNVFENSLNVAIERNISLNKFMSKLADIVRIPEPSKELYDLNELIKSVCILMNTNYPDKSITWQYKLSEKPFFVKIDVMQIEQVLINIYKNAIEAISKDGTIITQTFDYEHKQLKIIDNGIGIDRKTKENLFTPFYSTKRDGQGIGLTFIREILINHGFDFDLDTTKPGHTEFWIIFK